ncbi:MAG: PaaI family thioesterase [Actinobacteria bacterium]|nr:PaaI family thioesterase [Actinomycetota bacterium]
MTDPTATESLHELMPLGAHLEFSVVSSSADEVVLSAPWAPEHCTAGGILHGGFLMALADAAGALCAVKNLPPDTWTSTIESKTNMMRPVPSGTVTARSTPVHVGRTTIVVQTDITREDGKLAARTTQTQAVLPAR